MNSAQPILARTAYYCALGSAAAALFSIAVSQTLLALAFAALLMSGVKLRLPPVWVQAVLFMAGTVASLGLSGDAAAGRPQIRKFFVFLTLPVVFSALRTVADVRRLTLAWAGVAGLSAAWGVAEFGQKFAQAARGGYSFYEQYVGDRITGFMSHWMTFSGGLMIALIMLAAYLLFAPSARGKWALLGWLCAGVLGVALLAGITRSAWLASAVAAVYLVWHWKRRLLLALPLVAAAVFWGGPSWVRARVVSGFEPRGQLDSNQHRLVCWRTGWRMIQAHPWFGVGPEMVQSKLMDYVPPDVRRPLPVGWYGHLHSIYIHYAAERGVPTMLMLVWLLVKALWDFLRALRRLPAEAGEERFILHGAVAVVVAVAIAGAFELNLGDSEILAMFLAVVSCGYVAAGRAVSAIRP